MKLGEIRRRIIEVKTESRADAGVRLLALTRLRDSSESIINANPIYPSDVLRDAEAINKQASYYIDEASVTGIPRTRTLRVFGLSFLLPPAKG